MTGETKLYNDKVVISGRHVERYKYDRLQLDGCQNLKSYTKREIPEDEKLRNKRQNLYRAAKEIRRRIQAGKLPVSPHGKPYRIDRDGMFYRAREARERNQVQDWDQDQEEVS